MIEVYNWRVQCKGYEKKFEVHGPTINSILHLIIARTRSYLPVPFAPRRRRLGYSKTFALLLLVFPRRSHRRRRRAVLFPKRVL